MLYPYQTAEEHRAPLRERALLRQPAGLLALELVCTINDLFTAAPSLLYQEGTKGLLLLYRDSACDTSYLEEECRELMACLSSHWETALYGTAPGGETGELTFHLEEGNRILCRTRCVSGRPFDQLSGLCVKLEADSSEHAMCSARSAITPAAVLWTAVPELFWTKMRFWRIRTAVCTATSPWRETPAPSTISRPSL